jgi:hypothetical protein
MSTDATEIATLVEQLIRSRFWGGLSIKFQDGIITRTILEQSVLHPRQLIKNGETGHDNHLKQQ